MITIISAVAKNRVIGIGNDLPWNLSGDLKHFSTLTTGHTVLMGLNTYKSITSRLGKALPNRKNVVLTFAVDPSIKDLQITSWDEVVKLAKSEDIFVIGGASVYKQALPFADRLCLTEVDATPEGDAFFPEWDPSDWNLVSEEKHTKDEHNEYDYRFLEYVRK